MDNYCAAAASTSSQLNTLDTSISSGGLILINSSVIITNILFILKCICCLVVIVLDIFMFISIVGHCLRREKNVWFLTGICFLLLAYIMIIVLVTAHLFCVDEISIEFLCQSYITVVAVPRAIFWLNMQEND
jgi:hypothetical protein